MENKGVSFIVLLVIIAFLSLTITALAVYVFLGGNSHDKGQSVQTEQGVTRPADDHFVSKKLFEDKVMNLASENANQRPVIQINAGIIYYKKVEGVKNVEEKITFYEPEIKELFSVYFQKLTVQEAMKPEARTKAKEELKEAINELLNQSERSKKEFIYNVIMEDWVYQ